MALAPGARLGPYEILALLGQGGMGEVYRARDPRLGRDVAIKVVSGEGASDPVRRARFEQEARAAAALNHPHILAVHDIGTAHLAGGPTPYVVSELLEGETLRERLTRGKLPVRVATELAVQIARALAAAHDHGIVHRDIKPENLFVTKDGTAKVLDFGLAKLRDAGEPAGDQATTAEAHVGTGPGVVLGTVGYMAPEQVRAGTVDHRADLFALGCVLHELLGGQRAFRGASGVETLHAILNAEPPDLATLVPGLSGGLERIVRRCLEKDPLQRFQSARDLAFALEAVAETRSSATAMPALSGNRRSIALRERAAWATAMAATAVAGWLLVAGMRGAPVEPAPQVLRFDVDVSSAGTMPSGPILPRISPDGRVIVMRLVKDGTTRLVLRRMDSGALVEVPGTDGAGAAYWSPDARSLIFLVGPSLRRVDSQTGAAPEAFVAGSLAVGPNLALTWGRAGTLLALGGGQELKRLTAQGGQAESVPLSLAAGRSPAAPEFVGDGRRFLFTTTPTDTSGLYLANLGNPAPVLVANGISGRVVYVEPGYVVYRRQSALMAQLIDLSVPRLVGDAAVVATRVTGNAFSASPSVIVHAPASGGISQFAWQSRAGGETRAFGPPSRYQTFDLSPDERTIVVNVLDDDGQNLWAIDSGLGGLTRLTSGAFQDVDPRWSADGTEVLFGSTRAAARAPQRLSVAGQALSPSFAFPGASFALDDWSADGKWVVYHDATVPELLVRPIAGDGPPVVVARALSGVLDQAQMSPDSSLVTYHSNDSGRYEVFVVPFPPSGRRFRVSTDGGVQPTWRADGRELFYLALDGTLMAVQVTPGATPRFGAATALFQLGSSVTANVQLESYAPSPDGQRFLSLQPVGDAPRASLSVIVNWQQLLKPAPTTP